MIIIIIIIVIIITIHQCYIVLHCQFLALILTKLLYVIILVLDAPV